MFHRELWLVLAMLFVVGLLIYLIVCVILPLERFHKALRKIPGPKGYPIIGIAHLLNFENSEAIPFINKLITDHGPISAGWVFQTAHVVISDVNGIEKVLCSPRYIKKSTDYNFLKPWLQEGLLTSAGNKWHGRRKMLTPTFHFKILEDYLPVFNKNSVILVDKMRQQMNESYININNLITLCTLDIICETAMGTTINAQHGEEAEYVKAVQRMSELFQLRQLRVWLYNDFIFKLTPFGREQAKVLGILHGFSDKIIKQRRADYRAGMNDLSYGEERASSKRHKAFLDMLIEISEKEQELTDRDIQEEVDTFMFEGHDTTSSALSWTMYLLGLHPEIQDKVVEELNGIFLGSDRAPNYDDLGRMKYLEQVIKETLRLYPSVPAFSRQLQMDLEIMGYTIPAGANASIVPVLLHRDPKLYPDPEKFDPERFSPEVSQHRHPYAYLPFSAGPRGCIGQRFALLEEKVILSTVLRKFRLESVTRPEEIVLLMELILRPKDPLRIRIIPR